MGDAVEKPSDLSLDVEEIGRLRAECDRLMRVMPDADRHTVWHTLLMLRLSPLDRLRRSLLRGRGLRANKL